MCVNLQYFCGSKSARENDSIAEFGSQLLKRPHVAAGDSGRLLQRIPVDTSQILTHIHDDTSTVILCRKTKAGKVTAETSPLKGNCELPRIRSLRR